MKKIQVISLEHINPIAPSGHFRYDRGSFYRGEVKEVR